MTVNIFVQLLILMRLELFHIPDFLEKSGIYSMFILDYRAEKNGVE